MRHADDVEKVFVAGKDPLARGGVALLLAGQPSVSVVGQAGLVEDWAQQAVAAGAVAVVLDWNDVDEATRARIQTSPLPVVALVEDGEQARDALSAGAQAALGREGDARRLAAALEAAAQGLLTLDGRFGRALVRERPNAPVETLTAREHEVLQLLAQGLPNKLIAQRLSISDHTAKFHVNAILGKLGAESRTEAVVRAVQLGLVVL